MSAYDVSWRIKPWKKPNLCWCENSVRRLTYVLSQMNTPKIMFSGACNVRSCITSVGGESSSNAWCRATRLPNRRNHSVAESESALCSVLQGNGTKRNVSGSNLLPPLFIFILHRLRQQSAKSLLQGWQYKTLETLRIRLGEDWLHRLALNK